MKLANLNLFEDHEKPKYKSAVAIVYCREKYLLGLSKNSGDGRLNKWVFPGGRIKTGESPEKAAEREAREETGVTCKARKGIITDSSKKDVAFIYCKSSTFQTPKPNSEFAQIGWFTLAEMDSLKLYGNVKKLISKTK